jgi:hypothetical protein
MALSSSINIANSMMFRRHAVLACPPLAVRRRIFKESLKRSRVEERGSAAWSGSQLPRPNHKPHVPAYHLLHDI